MDDSGTTEEFYFGATVEVLQRLRLPEIDAEWVAASWDSQGCNLIENFMSQNLVQGMFAV